VYLFDPPYKAERLRFFVSERSVLSFIFRFRSRMLNVTPSFLDDQAVLPRDRGLGATILSLITIPS
jgi:hypothetical protein